MILAKVCGNIVLSHVEEGFLSQPIRLVQKLDQELKPYGAITSAIDRIGVGNGEIVLLETSLESSLGLSALCASDQAIIAIVDKMVG
ncbi:MAG: ethanolamine utilization protein EutN [Candidatus Cloacimonetes bacterium]|nr:ethanolamine utilization protein EutN [Candidatus Cloacimonadota bacterium]